MARKPAYSTIIKALAEAVSWLEDQGHDGRGVVGDGTSRKSCPTCASVKQFKKLLKDATP